MSLEKALEIRLSSGGKATHCYTIYNINPLNKKLDSFKNMLSLKLISKTQRIKHMKKI